MQMNPGKKLAGSTCIRKWGLDIRSSYSWLGKCTARRGRETVRWASSEPPGLAPDKARKLKLVGGRVSLLA